MPGGASFRPSPMQMEQAEPGGVSCTKRMPSDGPLVVVGVEADLVDVEILGAVHVGHRDKHQFKFPVHAPG